MEEGCRAGTTSDELKDLVKLEEENAGLKKLSTNRLHKENARTQKKLGLGLSGHLEGGWARSYRTECTGPCNSTRALKLLLPRQR